MMKRLFCALTVLLLALCCSAAGAAESYTAMTVSLDFEESTGGGAILYWEGEVTNDTLVEATLQVVLELRDPFDAVLLTLETGAINVPRFGTSSIKETFKVDKALWAKAEVLRERAEWSYKHPVNGQRITRLELFSTGWCSVCQEAMAYLEELGVNYVDYDIEMEPEALERLEHFNPDITVPTLVVNGDKAYVGFSKKGYAEAIEAEGM